MFPQKPAGIVLYNMTSKAITSRRIPLLYHVGAANECPACARARAPAPRGRHSTHKALLRVRVMGSTLVNRYGNGTRDLEFGNGNNSSSLAIGPVEGEEEGMRRLKPS